MVGSGEVPEWPKGADCKSAGVSLRRFESSPLHMNCGDHHVATLNAGIAQLARASAFQAEGRGFESRFPLCTWTALSRGPLPQPAHAQVAQSAEHILGKDEVGGSIPLLGFFGNVTVR
jgi:hypothetical protein